MSERYCIPKCRGALAGVGTRHGAALSPAAPGVCPSRWEVWGLKAIPSSPAQVPISLLGPQCSPAAPSSVDGMCWTWCRRASVSPSGNCR